jgi:hypothetical protein
MGIETPNIQIHLEEESGPENFNGGLNTLKSNEQKMEQDGMGRMIKLKDEIKTSVLQTAIDAGVDLNEIKSLDKFDLEKLFKTKLQTLDKDSLEKLFKTKLQTTEQMTEEIQKYIQNLLDKLDAKYEAIEAIDREYTVNGVHFLKCQIFKIIEALRTGKRVEIEAFGPYLRDYIEDLYSDEVNYTKTDAIGLAIMKLLFKLLPEAHAVSLYDEYNMWSVAENKLGQPVDKEQIDKMRKVIEGLQNTIKLQKKKEENWRTKAKQISKANTTNADDLRQQAEELLRKADNKKNQIDVLKENLLDLNAEMDSYKTGRLENESQALKDKFKEFVRESFIKSEIIKPDAVEGAEADYVLLSESEKIKDAEELVEFLKNINGKNLIEYGKGEEIFFQQKIGDCDDPRYLRINLRNKQGTWQCAALDASGFLNARNREIMHLVILPKENFEDQQNQVWEILHACGFEPENYHNIHFDTTDPAITPESAEKTFEDKFGVFFPKKQTSTSA